MLLVSALLLDCRRLTSSAILMLASEPRNFSSSIFASSSAIGCSNSRKFSAMKTFPRREYHCADQIPTIAPHQCGQSIEKLASWPHRPGVRQIEPSRIVGAADRHAHAAGPFEIRPQQLLEAAHAVRRVQFVGPTEP